MFRSRLWTAIAVLALVLFATTLSAPPADSQEMTQVQVVNFPTSQTIEGTVEVTNPVRHARATAIRDITVPPVPESQTTRWVDAGTLSTDGFPNVVLSLHGEIKGEVINKGDIAAVLIPLEPTITEAFEQRGKTHFELRVGANNVSGGSAYFASAQPRYTVGFPTYRVWLYNETDKTVTAQLFAYLTN